MKVAVRIYNAGGGGQYDVPPEGDIVIWIKSEGDRVEKGDALCEIETEKGVLPQIEAPAGGTIVDVAYPVGTTWIRGEVAEIIDHVPRYDPPLCWIETEEIVAVSLQESVSASVVEDPVITAKKRKPFIPLSVGRLMQEHSISIDDMLSRFPEQISFGEMEVNAMLAERYYIPPHDSLSIMHQEIPASEGAQETADVVLRAGHADERGYDTSVHTEQVSAVPAARWRATELGIDLALIRGSGPDGVILLQDVETHSRQSTSVPVPAPVMTLPSEEEIVPLKMSRLLRTIATHMQKANDIPTVDAVVTPDVFDFAPLISFHQRLRKHMKYGLWFPIMASAARVLAREEFIMFNSFFPEQEITSSLYVNARRRVHMGIAYDRGEPPVIDWPNQTIGGEGLRILVIRDAHIKTIPELLQEVQRLLKSAARRHFEFADTRGYTFIFNNLGALGHQFGRSLLGEDIASELNLGYVNTATGTGFLQIIVDHRLINGARTTPFVRAIHEEMIERVLPELEEYLTK